MLWSEPELGYSRKIEIDAGSGRDFLDGFTNRPLKANRGAVAFA
jgi:hypothetical protein